MGETGSERVEVTVGWGLDTFEVTVAGVEVVHNQAEERVVEHNQDTGFEVVHRGLEAGRTVSERGDMGFVKEEDMASGVTDTEFGLQDTVDLQVAEHTVEAVA